LKEASQEPYAYLTVQNIQDEKWKSLKMRRK